MGRADQHLHSAPRGAPARTQRGFRPQLTAFTLVCALSVAAFSLACQLIAAAHTEREPAGQPSLAQAIVGDTRLALGSQFYTQADVYFHRGVPHEKALAFDADPFQIVRNEVCPRNHQHLSGTSDIAEIMPWLSLATRVNPQNLNGYLVAAFWLASEAKRPELALRILGRAQCNIPYAYEVQLEKGRILLQTGEREQARQAFAAAIAFWEATADASNHDHLLDKAEALLYRALLREAEGETSGAIADLRAMLAISPENPAMHERLRLLERGQATSPPANDLLIARLRIYDTQRRECGDEDHDHDDHEAHGDES
ncbi:MAG: hypothetical protein HN341_17600 [Verrucomicrobia bacterium]|jgi:tetratricopeptide (TPR) repeat protein|nr:hypothetical protein [Verrucomicrobiota bacterium]